MYLSLFLVLKTRNTMRYKFIELNKKQKNYRIQFQYFYNNL